MSPERLGFLAIGIGAFATGEEASLAEEALATGDGERNDDAVANLQRLVFGADFNDLSHVFVAEDVALVHRRNNPVENVQVGTADRAGGDFDDGVSWVFNLWVGHALAAHVAFAVPGQCFHSNLCRCEGSRGCPREQSRGERRVPDRYAGQTRWPTFRDRGKSLM